MLIKNKKSGKLTYSIGQVSDYTDLPQSVLRYWETVFSKLNPAKSPGGSRKYSDEDVVIIQRIQDLLYIRGYTIKGANMELNKDSESAPNESHLPDKQTHSAEQSTQQNANTADFKAVINQLKTIMDELNSQ